MTKVSAPRISIHTPECKACGENTTDLRSLAVTNELGYGFSTPELCTRCLRELADAATKAIRELAS